MAELLLASSLCVFLYSRHRYLAAAQRFALIERATMEHWAHDKTPEEMAHWVMLSHPDRSYGEEVDWRRVRTREALAWHCEWRDELLAAKEARND